MNEDKIIAVINLWANVILANIVETSWAEAIFSICAVFWVIILIGESFYKVKKNENRRTK